MFPNKKLKIKEYIDKLISNTGYNQDFKERVIRSLTGDYTQEEIDNQEREAQEYLAQIEEEMIHKECIQPEPCIVFYNMTAEEAMKQGNICELSIQDGETDEANNV